MGSFLTITYEARYAGTKEKSIKLRKVIDYICHHIRDYGWQELIVGNLRNTKEHLTTISIVLRFFNENDIEEGKLKSYTRYMKKKDTLEVDQMLVLNKYVDLHTDEMRKQICNDVFDYLQIMLEKYKDRFLDFDSIAFIPLLKKRIEEIKDYKLIDKFADKNYETY